MELRIAIIEKRCSGEMEQLQGEVEQLRSDRDEMRLKLSAAGAATAWVAPGAAEPQNRRVHAALWAGWSRRPPLNVPGATPADASASETAAVRKEAEELRANAQVWSSEKAGLLEENSALRANQDSLRAASGKGAASIPLRAAELARARGEGVPPMAEVCFGRRLRLPSAPRSIDEAASEMAAVKGEVEDLRSAALDWAGKKAGLLEKIGVLKADRDVLRLRLAASGTWMFGGGKPEMGSSPPIFLAAQGTGTSLSRWHRSCAAARRGGGW